MFNTLAKKVFGNTSERILKKFANDVKQINALEEVLAKLSDEQLQGKTAEFRAKLAGGAKLESILHEAFAVVREASKRVLNMRHFDVQLIGGLVLHNGMISEMKTGEGKTLVATLAVYLNALEGKGVHVVTVNDYLAARDGEWMGKLYRFLGLSVGILVDSTPEPIRKEVYGADIVYGTNNQFGFDYLRDNLKFRREAMVQREYNFAIVDEVDSILIDEARTPLIISGPTDDSSELYLKINKIIPKLAPEDFDHDEENRSVLLTEQGIGTMEEMLAKAAIIAEGSGLYDMENVSVVHHVQQALRAHKAFRPDVDYIVKDNQVIIIDEFSGRMQEGRRFSEGLHQALEAKENVPIQRENQTLASVTFQNYFRLYHKLAGMTGTAATEAQEFSDIYGLEVIEIPTHVGVARIDEDDVIYRTEEEKYEAILQDIEAAHAKKQPVLLGTVSIEKSELLSKFLKKKKIPHTVLNAKFHDQEAAIIAQAGRPGAVTVATNMAGRGTDIKLGGDPELSTEKWDVAAEKKIVLEAGGLFVIGTERHESRRIDNQLRGRSGRQGDPGRSRFYVSLEDDLMRIFGSERISGLLEKLGLKQGESIVHPWISRTLETAQKKIEGRNYDARKQLLRFDDVMNDQRKFVYGQRGEVMDATSIAERVTNMRHEVIEDLVFSRIPEKSFVDEWDLDGLESEMRRIFGADFGVKSIAQEEGVDENAIIDRLIAETDAQAALKDRQFGENLMRATEKQIYLLTLDHLWKEHLHGLDELRRGIGLRSYGQKNPLAEYKHESFKMFEGMLLRLNEEVTLRLAHVEPQAVEVDFLARKEEEVQRQAKENLAAATKTNPVAPARVVSADQRDPANPQTWGRVGRNEVCPCGSGKKFKQCHGKLA